ncbi:MAG: purine-nucleoside phosphorylase [Defluviitaleaceae bacterium]|nr:purine-nucleoside phosphorylase [Defluviitaleaceae bacterium]
MYTQDTYRQAVDYIKSKLSFTPEALIILGSGLGNIADELEDTVYITYKEIPHFKISTAPGHTGQLIAGRLAGRNVLCMQGRLHIYEGYKPIDVAFPVRVASELGATRLVLTCACGGVNTDYSVGDLVMLKDYINMTHPGPLVGMDVSDFDTRFIDMSYAFDRDYFSLAKAKARKLNISLGTGVYYYMPGPQLETPAEIRAIRTLGGDLVGMSVVHEVIMARRLGMRVAGFALVTNMAAGILDAPLTEEEIFVEGHKARERFGGLLKAFIGDMS